MSLHFTDRDRQKMLEPSTKGYRDLFIGSIVYSVTESELQEAFGSAMMKMGLEQSVHQNPVVRVQISGTFGFMEMRTCIDAANALNLSGFPFQGNCLVIQRPRKYTGGSGIEGYLTWDATYTSWVEGDLRLKTAGAPSRVIVIANVTTPEELAASPAVYLNIIDDIRVECSSLGIVNSVIVPRADTNLGGSASAIGKVFVEMNAVDEAVRALLALKGRSYNNRIVDIKFYPETAFRAMHYTVKTPPVIITAYYGAATKEMVFTPEALANMAAELK